MEELFRLLGSLLVPAIGFVTNLLTSKFGWGQTVNLAKQFFFQCMFVAMFMSVSSTGTFFTAAALTLVHMGCAFLILTMLLGSAFSANFGARDQLDFGRQSLLVAIAITSVPTALILGLAWLFSASTLLATLLVFIFSVLTGAAIDVTAVLSPYQKAATESPVHASATAEESAPTTAAEESAATTTEESTATTAEESTATTAEESSSQTAEESAPATAEESASATAEESASATAEESVDIAEQLTETSRPR